MKKFGRKRRSICNTTYEDVRKTFDDLKRKIADSGRLSSSGFSPATSPRSVSWRKDYPCDLISSSGDDLEDWSSFISSHNSELGDRSGPRTPSPGSEAQESIAVNHGILSSSETYDESLGFSSFLEEESKKASRIQNITFRRKKGENGNLLELEKCNIDALQEENLEVAALKKISFDRMPKNVRKIGEATFSEVFSDGLKVYKIVPLGDTDDETSLESFLKESAIFKTISSEDGVCRLKDVFLVEGKYPEEYLKAWDDYGEEENERPSKYSDSQKYGVIVMEDGGESLESTKFQGAEEMDRFIRRVIEILANLEEKYEFEHRDLHWGNILIKEDRISLIDFSLSRLKDGDSVIFSNLNDKQWLFEGDEAFDIQFKVYKDMLKLCSGCWSRFTPQSNALWIRYLVEKTFGKGRFKGKKDLVSQYLSIIDSSTSARDIDAKLKRKEVQ
ncbi:haspin Ser/Thr kinase [Encephalitozoon intestinalis]|nr:haspin Ser/Thr kinase [Encephalitozoon intestinalis]